MWIQSEGNVIKMYGTIWDGDGAYLSSDLNRAIGKQKEVFVHLHTPGGSVIDGNLIYNTLKNSKAKINIVIDGLAASMGSIIMLAGDTIKMAENALLMIHAPSGSARGTAQDLNNVSKLLTSLEKNFVKKYTTKTELNEEEVKAWLVGDNWFTAEEAITAGLVDESIESQIEDLSMLSSEMKLTALQESFEPFNEPKEETPQNNPKNKKEDNMKLSAQTLTILGLGAAPKDEDVNAAVEAMNSKNKELEAKLKANNEAKIKALIDGALASGQIKEDTKGKWTALAEQDFELASESLSVLPKAQRLPGANPESKSDLPQGRDGWTKKEWKQKDLAGLVKMKTDNPEAYAKIMQS